MDEFKNIQVYSEVNGILSVDGISMGETNAPLCFLLPRTRSLISFSPLTRAETGFYLGFSRIADVSGDVPQITEDDGALRITAAGNTLIADLCPPFLPEQPRPPHILASAAAGRYKAMVYWDRWITFAIEDDRGEMVYARSLSAEKRAPDSARAEVFFRSRGGMTVVFGAYRTEECAHIACASVSGKELLFKECSAYSFGEKLVLKHAESDGLGSVYIETYAMGERGFAKTEVSCTRSGEVRLFTPGTAVHALALAVERGCESAAMSLISPGLRTHLDMARLKEYFGEVCGVETRLTGSDSVLLKYQAGNYVYTARRVGAELTGGLISNITMD